MKGCFDEMFLYQNSCFLIKLYRKLKLIAFHKAGVEGKNNFHFLKESFNKIPSAL